MELFQKLKNYVNLNNVKEEVFLWLNTKTECIVEIVILLLLKILTKKPKENNNKIINYYICYKFIK